MACPFRLRRLALLAFFAVELLLLPGCLQRRIRVFTDPPGATVWLNDTEIGRSPVDTQFTYFGRYDVRAAKDGYQTLNTTRVAVAPWYEYPFIDLLAVALPFDIETRVRWRLTLEPLRAQIGTPEDGRLLERANSLRHELGADRDPKP